MLQILSDTLMLATRMNPRHGNPERHLPNPQHEENRRRAWSLITGLRL